MLDKVNLYFKETADQEFTYDNVMEHIKLCKVQKQQMIDLVSEINRIWTRLGGRTLITRE